MTLNIFRPMLRQPYPRNPNFVDEVGKRYVRLLVRWYVGSEYHQSRWWCKCDCGNLKIVSGGALRRGNTTSCGCLHWEVVTKHGQGDTPEYHAWEAMIARCYNPKNPKYSIYGGRGIRVCSRWRFGDGTRSGSKLFLMDMGQRPTKGHSLDRIKSTDGYRPRNCRWATHAEQQENRRDRIWVVYHNEHRLLTDVLRESGLTNISPNYYVTKKGWSHQQTLDHLLKKRSRRIA